jgi:transcriptional regulator with PAS, ATPase and Fis domain
VIANEVAAVGDLPTHMQKPGNPEKMVARSAIDIDAKDVRRFDLSVNSSPGSMTDSDYRPLKQQVKEFESGIINKAIEELGTKRKAARALGVDIGTIVRKTKR